MNEDHPAEGKSQMVVFDNNEHEPLPLPPNDAERELAKTFAYTNKVPLDENNDTQMNAMVQAVRKTYDGGEYANMIKTVKTQTAPTEMSYGLKGAAANAIQAGGMPGGQEVSGEKVPKKLLTPSGINFDTSARPAPK